MATMTRKGYGQVEPNHLSAQYTGQIYAQLPALTIGTPNTAITQLENGQFLKYDYKNGAASVSGSGEWMLVFNEVKLYDERRQNYKDFAMKSDDFTDGKIYPRLLKTNVGDIFTTNTFLSNDATPVTVSGPDQEITMPALAVGDYLQISDAGWLTKYTPGASDPDMPASGIVFQVVPHFTQGSNEYFTLPDGQNAVKIQRVQ